MFNGELIKHLRNVKKLKQQYLADKLGVTRSTISNWENGKRIPDLITFIRLSELLGVSMDLFLLESVEQRQLEILSQLENFLEDKNINAEQKKLLCENIEKRLKKKF